MRRSSLYNQYFSIQSYSFQLHNFFKVGVLPNLSIEYLPLVAKRKIAQYINEVSYASDLSCGSPEEIDRSKFAFELVDFASHLRVEMRCHEIQENLLALYWQSFGHSLHLSDGRLSQLQSVPRDESNILNDLIVNLPDALPVSEVFDDVLLAVVDSDQRSLVELANQRNYACCHVTLRKFQIFADVFTGLVRADVDEVEQLGTADVKDLEFVARQAWTNRAEVYRFCELLSFFE